MSALPDTLCPSPSCFRSVRDVLVHEEALRRQLESDILVLLQWNDPKEQGSVPGKFFEYLGARRPILVLGLHDGVPATILRERNAGFFSNEPKDRKSTRLNSSH